MTLRGQYFSTM